MPSTVSTQFTSDFLHGIFKLTLDFLEKKKKMINMKACNLYQC